MATSINIPNEEPGFCNCDDPEHFRHGGYVYCAKCENPI